MNSLPSSDLASIVARVGPLRERLRGKRLLVTGATGFIGRWMVNSLMEWDGYADEDYEFSLRAIARHIDGDIRTCEFYGPCDFILHLAGPPACHPNDDETWAAIYNGTKRVCDFAKKCRARLLFASSGAAVDCKTIYGFAKCAAEGQVAQANGINARIYTVYGPGMNLDRYAVGAFIQQALAGGPITVTGDPRKRRAFQYIADTVTQLWYLLLAADPGTYDVGAATSHSIHEAAMAVAQQFDTPDQHMPIHLSSGFTGEPEAYVPPCPMGGDQVGLSEGVRRTIEYMRANDG